MHSSWPAISFLTSPRQCTQFEQCFAIPFLRVSAIGASLQHDWRPYAQVMLPAPRQWQAPLDFCCLETAKKLTKNNLVCSVSLCLTCTSCCHVAARFLCCHCRLPLCLQASVCFTRTANAISATEPWMRVCVPHGQSKVMSSTRSQHDQPAQPPNKNTLQGNSSPTAQALLRTLTANHEPQCKAMNFAAFVFLSLRGVALPLSGQFAKLCSRGTLISRSCHGTRHRSFGPQTGGPCFLF